MAQCLPIRHSQRRVGLLCINRRVDEANSITSHTPFKDAASIEQGIVIDLSNMPSAGLSADMQTMTVSPARRWDDLYEELQSSNLTVVGGRVAGVGVGGLVTGCASILPRK